MSRCEGRFGDFTGGPIEIERGELRTSVLGAIYANMDLVTKTRSNFHLEAGVTRVVAYGDFLEDALKLRRNRDHVDSGNGVLPTRRPRGEHVQLDESPSWTRRRVVRSVLIATGVRGVLPRLSQSFHFAFGTGRRARFRADYHVALRGALPTLDNSGNLFFQIDAIFISLIDCDATGRSSGLEIAAIR